MEHNRNKSLTYRTKPPQEGHMHDSRRVANRFLELARDNGVALTPMQILKLVYIAHGWMLGLYGRPLIRDEVQAWRYGPVIPRLYNAVRQYRAGPVTRQLTAPAEELDEFEDDIIGQVYRLYGKKSGVTLSRLTHAPDTPWALSYEPGEFGTPIPQDLIQEHYQQLAAK
jgi:uncharacterized phage-associated protein